MPADNPSYTIGPGDVLQVNVYKEPDASIAAVSVRSDGAISLPLIREVVAAGLTPRQLEAKITEQLGELIKDPDVTVLVKEVHSEKIYVIGAVRKEAPISLVGPMTVLQAIAEAGGLNDYAKRSKIYILRRQGGQQARLPFDYKAVIRGEHSEQNILLRAGDTVVVP
jgi:polysaccharide export outer membrane protein